MGNIANRADSFGDRMVVFMMGPRFDYKSLRSRKARSSLFIKNYLIVPLYFVTIIMLTAGFLLVYTHISAGWLSIGLASALVVLIEWYNGDLKELSPAKRPQSIDDVLSLDVLSRIPKKCSPKDIASITSQTVGGHFFAIRFGISPIFLQEIASGDPNDMADLWRAALALRIETKTSEITSAMLVVALIKSSPSHLVPLNHLQLDVSDLSKGLDWFAGFMDKIKNRHTVPRTGGIARDWSFGWTPLLDRLGDDISRYYDANEILKYESHEIAVEQLISIFSKKGRHNAVLVGGDGTGKTEIVRSFASRIMDSSFDYSADLQYSQIFLLDSASIIAASNNQNLETIFNKIFNEAFSAKNVILCLNNASLFLEDKIGSVDVSNLLRPIIEAGRLRIIMSMTEQEWLKLGERNPEFCNLLNKITISPATDEDTLKIMMDKSALLESQYSVTYMYQAIVESQRLSKRYIYNAAMPGRALNLMELAAQYPNQNLVTSESVKTALESTLNIKVASVDDEECDKLANLESLLHDRVIGQDRAVSVVSDALRRSRSGVGSTNRPVGVFMFLGPTGVGKTELAKALAAVFYGDEKSIIRLDMNEYSTANDSDRLIEAASTNSNSLTAQVMKRPFSVILLDEIEKAHPNVILSLLQMIDEGVLRDIDNREVNFRDAIIISTSNAGADRLREILDRGLDSFSFEEQFVQELSSAGIFKPEFLNRFDEIVTFKPLTKQELIKVADIIISGINKNLDLQKMSIKLDDKAKEYLIEKSYNSQMGARPLRRAFQRTVENIIAGKMLNKELVPGDELCIDIDQVRMIYEKAAR